MFEARSPTRDEPGLCFSRSLFWMDCVFVVFLAGVWLRCSRGALACWMVDVRLKPRGVGTASDRGRRQNGGRERGRGGRGGGGGVAQTWADCESSLSVRLPLTIHLRLSGFFSSVSFVLVCFPLASCTRLYSLPLIKSLSLGVFASPFMLCSHLSLPFHFNSSSFLFPLSHIQLFISLFPSLLPSRFCLRVFCDASFFFRHLLYHVCSRSPFSSNLFVSLHLSRFISFIFIFLIVRPKFTVFIYCNRAHVPITSQMIHLNADVLKVCHRK